VTFEKKIQVVIQQLGDDWHELFSIIKQQVESFQNIYHKGLW
jgi:hypothetical protein